MTEISPQQLLRCFRKSSGNGLRKRRRRAGLEVVRGRREVGLDRDEIGEGGALAGGEVAGEAAGVERGLTLLRGKIAELAEGAGDGAAAIVGQAAKLLHGAADLLTLLGVELLHGLGAVEHVLTLCGRHVIELGQAIAHALLDRRREIAEAGLLFEGALLLRERHTAVAVHPLGEMLLTGVRADGCAGFRLARAVGAMRGGRGGAPAALGRSDADEKQNGKCRDERGLTRSGK